MTNYNKLVAEYTALTGWVPLKLSASAMKKQIAAFKANQAAIAAREAQY